MHNKIKPITDLKYNKIIKEIDNLLKARTIINKYNNKTMENNKIIKH
jgi:hypothetical protein